MKAWLKVAPISEMVELEKKAKMFIVAGMLIFNRTSADESRCKTLLIDAATLALPEKERSVLFRPLFN